MENRQDYAGQVRLWQVRVFETESLSAKPNIV